VGYLTLAAFKVIEADGLVQIGAFQILAIWAARKEAF
jgi:hypothetical protein